MLSAFTLALPLLSGLADAVPNVRDRVNETVYFDLFGEEPHGEAGMFFGGIPQVAAVIQGWSSSGGHFEGKFSEVVELDIAEPQFLESLTPEQLASMQDVVSMHSVIGDVRNTLAKHEVGGVLVERRLPTGFEYEFMAAVFVEDLPFLDASISEQIFPTCNESTSYVIPVYNRICPDCTSEEVDACWAAYWAAIQDATEAYQAAAAAAEQKREEYAQELEYARIAVTITVQEYDLRLRMAFRFFGATADGSSTSVITRSLFSDFQEEMIALVILTQGALDALEECYESMMAEATSEYQAACATAHQELTACLANVEDCDCPPILIGILTITISCERGVEIEYVGF